MKEINKYPKPKTPKAVKDTCQGKALLTVDYAQEKLKQSPDGSMVGTGEYRQVLLPICLILATEYYVGPGTIPMGQRHASWSLCPKATSNPSEMCPMDRCPNKQHGTQEELVKKFDQGIDGPHYNIRTIYRKTLGD
jgi:hypothetical protein